MYHFLNNRQCHWQNLSFFRSIMVNRFLISFFVTAAIIFLLFTQISVRDLSDLLMKVDPLWTGIGSLFYLLGLLLRALRYHWLIHSKKFLSRDYFRSPPLQPGHHGPSFEVRRTDVPLFPQPCGRGEFHRRVGLINHLANLRPLCHSGDLLHHGGGLQETLRIGLFWIILISGGLTCLIVIILLNLSRLLTWLSMLINNGLLDPDEDQQPSSGFKRRSSGSQKTFMPSMPGGISSRGTGDHLELAHDFSDVPCLFEGIRNHRPFLKVVFGSTVALLASAIPISGLGNWGMLEAGWAAGFFWWVFRRRMRSPQASAFTSWFS